jgi:hypothetical protein
MMDHRFTVTLSKGAYVVNEEDAERILGAIAKKEPHVLVNADTFGDGVHIAPVRIVTVHVISVIENPPKEGAVERVKRTQPLVRLRALNGGVQPTASSL